MRSEAEEQAPRRILLVLPNWVGDVVLATPALKGVRARFPKAEISVLFRPFLAELLRGCGWFDHELHWPAQNGLGGALTFVRLAKQVRSGAFDTAVLFTHSFRSALLARLARIPQRVGFARDFRGWLLTDRLPPLREAGRFVPAPVSAAYADLVRRLGCSVDRLLPTVGVSERQEAEGRELLARYRLNGNRYAILSAGAAFGAAKCWLPERFAEVCDGLAKRYGLTPVLVGAPGERSLMRRIAGLARQRPVVCDDPFTTLGTLKVLVRGAALMVCNDSGPRHVAIAFNVPLVTVFGPTHQAWTDTGYAGEIKLQAQVECGPCQLRRCPLDHRCMAAVTSEQVLEAVQKLAPVPIGATAPGLAEVNACG